MKYFLSCFWILGSSICFAQNNKVDSLLTILKTTKEDTIKVNALNDLFLKYEFTDNVKAKEYLNMALELSKKINYKKGLATTYIDLGYFASDKSNYSEALKNYFTSLEIYEAIDDKNGIADSYNNIGLVYSCMGNYPDALKKHLTSLKIRELILDGNKNGFANSYNNIGNVYFAQKNYPEALNNYFKSLKILESLGDKISIAASYNNIGGVYYVLGNYQEALKKYAISFKMRNEAGDYIGIATSYNNMGNVYTFQSGKEENPILRDSLLSNALKNYLSSLKITKAVGDKAGIAGSYCNVGSVFTKQKKYKLAEEFLTKAKELSKEIGYIEILRDTYIALIELDTLRGNFKGAFENHKLYILYRDSLDNEETRKNTIQSQMTYDFDKKEAVADAEHKKELENQQSLADEKSTKQKVVLFLVCCFLAFVLIFAGFVFRSLHVTRKQKDIIEEQKQLVDQKQKEILDSIYYARRIQNSLLPTEKYIDKNLNRLMKK